MIFKTSYFANLKNINSEIYEPISIARFQPKNLQLKMITYIAPEASFLQNYKVGFFTKLQYNGHFQNLLNRLNYQTFKQDCRLLTSKIPVLCCYEKPGEFCHRHLVAQWIRDNSDECEELTNLSEWV